MPSTGQSRSFYNKLSAYKKKRLNKTNAVYTSPTAGTVLINYSDKNQLLEIEFVGGRVYHFLDVPPVVWQECKWVLKSGTFSTSFVDHKLRSQFNYEIVD